MLKSLIRNGTKVLIFLDTEFSDLIDMDLLSIALVAESGDEFYGERNDVDQSKFPFSDFVKNDVLPQLGQDPTRSMTRDNLSDEVRCWLEQFKNLQPRPCICYDYFGDFALLQELMDRQIPGWLLSKNI
jgi:hypothetical protein